MTDTIQRQHDNSAAQLVPSPDERRRQQREAMIDAILDAACQVMRENGVAALNMQEVARRVGMRAPSLYNYFPSMMAIYEAVFARGMRMFRERMERLSEQHDAADWEAHEVGLRHYMEFAKQRPELFQLLFERPVPGFVPSEEGLDEGRKLIEAANGIVARAIDSGLIDSGLTPAQTRDLFLALMHGITALHMANEPELPIGEGRFGSLIPAAMDLLKKAWGSEHASP